jgi:16S rRNA (uracil1498-N3)-methyltransferase
MLHRFMTRRRWLADEVRGDEAALTGKHAEHLSRVLRARVGQEFDVSAAGRLRRGRVVAVADGRVEFALGEELPASAEANLNVTLLVAIYKFDRMEWALEKLTELGAARIIPVVARRTDAGLAKAAGKRVERWRRIAQEASEQSRGLAPPEILAPKKLKEAVATSALTRVVLAESEQSVSLADVMRVHPAGEALALAVGPEGGWTEDELRLFAESGWTAASLGQRILRAETAAIAAMAVVASRPS